MFSHQATDEDLEDERDLLVGIAAGISLDERKAINKASNRVSLRGDGIRQPARTGPRAGRTLAKG